MYPPEITNIELDEKFNLDISQKPLLDKPNTLLPILPYTGNMVRSSSHNFPNMNTNQKITTNYSIETIYWNGKSITNCHILINIGVNENYISHRLVDHLPIFNYKILINTQILMEKLMK